MFTINIIKNIKYRNNILCSQLIGNMYDICCEIQLAHTTQLLNNLRGIGYLPKSECFSGSNAFFLRYEYENQPIIIFIAEKRQVKIQNMCTDTSIYPQLVTINRVNEKNNYKEQHTVTFNNSHEDQKDAYGFDKHGLLYRVLGHHFSYKAKLMNYLLSSNTFFFSKNYTIEENLINITYQDDSTDIVITNKNPEKISYKYDNNEIVCTHKTNEKCSGLLLDDLMYIPISNYENNSFKLPRILSSDLYSETDREKLYNFFNHSNLYYKYGLVEVGKSYRLIRYHANSLTQKQIEDHCFFYLYMEHVINFRAYKPNSEYKKNFDNLDQHINYLLKNSKRFLHIMKKKSKARIKTPCVDYTVKETQDSWFDTHSKYKIALKSAKSFLNNKISKQDLISSFDNISDCLFSHYCKIFAEREQGKNLYTFYQKQLTESTDTIEQDQDNDKNQTDNVHDSSLVKNHSSIKYNDPNKNSKNNYITFSLFCSLSVIWVLFTKPKNVTKKQKKNSHNYVQHNNILFDGQDFKH